MEGKLTANNVLQGILSSKAGVLSGLIKQGDVLVGTLQYGGSSGSGTWNYNDLQNLPELNGVVLKGNKASEDYYLPKVIFNSTEYWNSTPSLISEQNTIYVYTDYKQTQDGYYIAGIKVGDGSAYVVDLPFIDTLIEQHMTDATIHVTPKEKEFWNNKVNVVDDARLVNGTLILNRS